MRTYYILKQDDSGDIAKILIPSNISSCIEGLINSYSSSINIDSHVFPMSSESNTYRDLFGDWIQDIKITHSWVHNNYTIKIISWEMKPR